MAQRYGQIILAAGLAVLTAASASVVSAQSTYGCTNLAGRHNLPSVEGVNGFFFPIDPDLRLFHSISEQSIAELAVLSDALKEAGTVLIYAPVPTRALAMPGRLPHIARDYGFKPDLAATVYDDTIRRLTRAGVHGVNVRRALRLSENETPPFFATDPRLTPAGAQRLANAIAAKMSQTDGFAALPKAGFATQAGAVETWPSTNRAILQRHCALKLPEVRAPGYITTKTRAAAQGTDTSIFANQTSGARIALVGSDVTGSPVSNLSGFLSQATGFDVVKYSVPEGGSFAAISSYLTSSAFGDARPAYLVWTNPISNNLAQYGDQPLRELTAAARGACRVSVPFTGGRQVFTIRADLGGLAVRPSNTLFVDADGAPASEAWFDFYSPAGLLRSKVVVRHPEQVKTGRFYVPFSGLWRDGVQSVDISLDVAFGPDTRVSLCFE